MQIVQIVAKIITGRKLLHAIVYIYLFFLFFNNQGRGLIVDDRGVVCLRHEVLSNGCCMMEQKQTPKNEESMSIKKERYSCKTCNPQGCCTIYEYCVSCCLHPDKVNFY